MSHRYWNADSDMDWQDSVGMYAPPPEEPEADDTPDRAPPMTRAAALEAFFAAVAAAIPETEPNWLELRRQVRAAGVAYACAATRETVNDTNRAWTNTRKSAR